MIFGGRERIEVSDRAAQIHARALVADLHVDSGVVHNLVGYDITKRHSPFPYSPLVWQADIPRMIEGGVNCVGFGIVTNPLQSAAKRNRSALNQVDYFHRIQERTDKLMIARTAADVEQARAQGRIAAVLGLEGAHGLHHGVEDLERLHGLGLRYLTLAHFSKNAAATPAYGKGADKDSGLSDYGCELVKACGRIGVMIDLAHINKAGFMQAAQLAQGPIFASHTGVCGVMPHWRNLDDDQLGAIAQSHGCVGVIFGCHFLSPNIRCDLDRVADHICYIAEHFGAQTPAIGSDIDGFLWTLPRGMHDISQMPALTELLCRRGFSDEELLGILGGNFLRTMAQLDG
ncbi:MAG: membrane dipeptidase [Candidatus Alcyoniella australis]|nr:membrane dipeptidase [Candidatus Alcyoniella australis]